VDRQTAAGANKSPGIAAAPLEFLGCHRPPRSLAPFLLGTGEEPPPKAEVRQSLPVGPADRAFVVDAG
jgi:hypothetical protein